MTGQQAVSILRNDLGLSGVQAAALLGVHPNTIYNWGKGEKVSPSTQRFIMLLRARPELLDVVRRLAIEEMV